MSANLSIARPLLVVHSGKTTIDLSAACRISSRVLGDILDAYGGMWPVARSIESKGTLRNPMTDLRTLGALFGDDNAAEPVPVFRPGVCMMGVEAREDWVGISTASHTGKTKVGLNLEKMSIV